MGAAGLPGAVLVFDDAEAEDVVLDCGHAVETEIGIDDFCAI
jgi:hypothetical protein